MKIEYRKADIADAELLIDIYNSAFYSDYIKYGECPAYGGQLSDYTLLYVKYQIRLK